MTLREYVPRGRRKDFAAQIGISYVYLRRLLGGRERGSAELSVEIDRKTLGKVSAADMRPDLYATVRPAV